MRWAGGRDIYREWGTWEMHTFFYLKGRNHMEIPDVDERIILKRIVRKSGVGGGGEEN
jgi:hypothetical protein